MTIRKFFIFFQKTINRIIKLEFLKIQPSNNLNKPEFYKFPYTNEFSGDSNQKYKYLETSNVSCIIKKDGTFVKYHQHPMYSPSGVDNKTVFIEGIFKIVLDKTDHNK